MSLRAPFNPQANVIQLALSEALRPVVTAKAKRAAPFSIRLSESERVRLTAEAGGIPLGAFIKAKALGDALPARRSGLAVEDRKALAKVLALLGGTRLSSHIGEMAKLASTGSLPITPETLCELNACLEEIKALRALLMQALGLRAEHAR